MKFFPALLFPLIWAVVVGVRIVPLIRKLKSQGVTWDKFKDAAQSAQWKQTKVPPQPAPRISAIALLFLLILGGAMFGTGCWMDSSIRQFKRTAVKADGYVMALLPRRGSKGSVSYAPQVRFQTPDERQIIFETRMSVSRNLAPYPGSVVAVLYDPSNPSNARIDRFVFLWLFPVLLMGIGGMFLLIAGFGLFKRETPAPVDPLSLPAEKKDSYHLPNLIR